MRPQLDAANVKFVGIGLEELGLEEFVEGKYFDGELYLDVKKQAYEDLGAKRMGKLATIASLISKKTREFAGLAKKENISGNFQGDGLLLGGTIVVSAKGELLLTFKQEDFADHVEQTDVYRVLGIEEKVAEGTIKPKEACDENVCKLET